MKIQRTLPPAAAPLRSRDIVEGIKGWMQGQTRLDGFREGVRAASGARYAYLVSSGKAALYLVLKALKRLQPERTDVLIPAFTCFSVPSAVVRANLRVRLCDLDPYALDFDRERLAEAISKSGPSLLAVIPTRLFGLDCEPSAIRHLLSDPDVAIVEDAAQFFPYPGDGRPLNAAVDTSFYSLGRGKALTTVEGGVILTNRKDLSEAIQSEIKYLPKLTAARTLTLLAYAAALSGLLHPYCFWLPKSMPFLRLGETVYDPTFHMAAYSPFQAGIAAGWQTKYAYSRNRRHHNVKEWQRRLPGRHLDLVTFPVDDRQCGHLLRYPIRIADPMRRQRLLDHSESVGLGIMPSYPSGIHRIPALAPNFIGESYPHADTLAREIVTLPVHAYVSSRDVDRIEKALGESKSGRPEMWGTS